MSNETAFHVKSLSAKELEVVQSKIETVVNGFEQTKILVVGDVGLDEYLTGEVKRISPEAPVPVVEVTQQDHRLGLAANVAQNIHSLGGMATLIGLVGRDESAQELAKILKQNGVKDSFLVSEEGRPTTRKVRIMSGQHHVVRIDFESKRLIGAETQQKLLSMVQSALYGCSGVIIQDYGKGAVSEDFCQSTIQLAHEHGLRVAVDPHRTTPVHYYRGADLIKPNKDEAFILSGLHIDDLRQTENSIHQVAQSIMEKTNCQRLIITKGGQGVNIYDSEKSIEVTTRPQQVFDVTGAGDTFLAAFCLAWFSNQDEILAAVLANAAAGVVVGKVGCVPCTKEELLAHLSR